MSSSESGYNLSFLGGCPDENVVRAALRERDQILIEMSKEAGTQLTKVLRNWHDGRYRRGGEEFGLLVDSHG